MATSKDIQTAYNYLTNNQSAQNTYAFLESCDNSPVLVLEQMEIDGVCIDDGIDAITQAITCFRDEMNRFFQIGQALALNEDA